MKTYPDVTSILKQKAARRKRQAELTFEEKIAIVNRWRRLTKQIEKNRLSDQGIGDLNRNKKVSR